MEAVGATASIVGIISFGLGLAKSLQTFIDSVIEAEETMVLIVADVKSTASTLKDLEDFIDHDEAASKERNRATVFNATSIKEISACALQCQKIYVQIIVLIEKARMQVDEDGSKEAGAQAPAADDVTTPAARLAVFSENVTKFGRKMRWPWLEPRIKRCQEHLGRLKANLMLRLLVASIAGIRAHSDPPVARILGTGDENEIRGRAERLRDRVAEFQDKKGSPNESSMRPPGWGDGVREMTAATHHNVNASTSPRGSSASSPVIVTNIYPSSSSSGSERELRSSFRMFRPKRAWLDLRDLKAFTSKRIERKAVFKKDSASAVFEAYIIYPSPFGNLSPRPVKLPFGHRRLTREVKQALRKYNPWDILVILAPHDQTLVDKAVKQIQLAAKGSMDVCLVAIEVARDSDTNISRLEVGKLEWTRMILFFRFEPVTEARPRLTTQMRRVFLGSQRANRKQVTLQEKLQREQNEKLQEEAKNKADREFITKGMAELEEAKKNLETERAQVEQDRGAVERKHRAVKSAEEAVLKCIEKGTTEEELKKIFKEESAMKKAREEEEAEKKASEEKAPVQFNDAVQRKFIFPFHLIQTWQGMEDLIKKASSRPDPIGSASEVQEGHYDLINSEGEIILPSAWAATIKPGASVSMIMWRGREWTKDPQRASPSMRGPIPGTPPYFASVDQEKLALPINEGASTMPTPAYDLPTAPTHVSLSPSVPQRPMFPFRERAQQAALPTIHHKRRHHSDRRTPMAPIRPPQFYHAPWLAQREPMPQNSDSEYLGNIDKELGLDDLETAGQIASKDIDELLAAWTNPASGEGNDGAPPLSS